MKALVTGGAGFLGSHVVEELVRRGYAVTAFDNLSSGRVAFLAPLIDAGKVHLWHGDVRDDGLIFTGYDIVMHLAAEPYIPACFDRPVQFFETNAHGTLNVLLAARTAKKVLVVSSSEVYGTGPGHSMDEQTPVNPQSTYAVTKLAGDRLALTLHKEHGIPSVIVRPFNVYGPRETQPYVIPEIIAQADRNGGRLVLGNIGSVRDFSFVADTAAALCDLAEQGVPGEVYNWGSGEVHTIQGVAQAVCESMGLEAVIEFDEAKLRPHDVTFLQADSTKATALIGARVRTPLSEGIDRTVAWYRDNGNRWSYETTRA